MTSECGTVSEVALSPSPLPLRTEPEGGDDGAASSAGAEAVQSTAEQTDEFSESLKLSVCRIESPARIDWRLKL